MGALRTSKHGAFKHHEVGYDPRAAALADPESPYQCRSIGTASDKGILSSDVEDYVYYEGPLGYEITINPDGTRSLSLSHQLIDSYIDQYFLSHGCDMRSQEEIGQIRKDIKREDISLPPPPVSAAPGAIVYMSPLRQSESVSRRQIWTATYASWDEIPGIKVVLDQRKKPPHTNSVWARDFGAIVENTLFTPDTSMYIETPYHDFDRRIARDSESFSDSLQKQGIDINIVELKGVTFEGGQIKQDMSRGIIFAGTGGTGSFAEEREGLFEEIVNSNTEEHYSVVNLETVGDYYHLDLAVSPLQRGHVLIDSRGLTPESVQRIVDIYGDQNVIDINEVDGDKEYYRGRSYANLTPVGPNILQMTGASPELQSILQRKGYEVRSHDSKSFGYDGLNCRGNVIYPDKKAISGHFNYISNTEIAEPAKSISPDNTESALHRRRGVRGG